MLGNGISDGVGIGYAKTIENVQTTYTVVDIKVHQMKKKVDLLGVLKNYF